MTVNLSGAAIIAQAQTWLGVPYNYGGGRGSPASARLNGVDCSGFVYQVFMAFGVDPGTDTVSQYNNPAAIAVPQPAGQNDLTYAQPGDLIFFGSPAGGTQEHVGIYLGQGMMIDAPHTGTTVRLDPVVGFENILGIRRFTTPSSSAITSPDPNATLTSAGASTGSLNSASSSLGRLTVEAVAVLLAVALVGAGVFSATRRTPSPEPTP